MTTIEKVKALIAELEESLRSTDLPVRLRPLTDEEIVAVREVLEGIGFVDRGGVWQRPEEDGGYLVWDGRLCGVYHIPRPPRLVDQIAGWNRDNPLALKKED